MAKNEITLKKVTVKEHTALKDKLIEVRRVGAHPIFVKLTKKDNISKILEKADIPTTNEVKVEGIKPRGTKWHSLKLNANAYSYAKIAVTTKVKGSN